MGPQSQRNTRQRKGRLGSERNAGRRHPNHWNIPARRPEEMVDRRGLKKKRPKIEKRKQRDERKEAGCRHKGGYKRNAKKRAISRLRIGYTRKGLPIHYAPSATSIYPSTSNHIQRPENPIS
jgi:hypothetical protein